MKDFRILDVKIEPSFLIVGSGANTTNAKIIVDFKNSTSPPASNVQIEISFPETAIATISENPTASPYTRTLEGKDFASLNAGNYKILIKLSGTAADDSQVGDYFEKYVTIIREETVGASATVPEMPPAFAILAFAGVLAMLYFKSIKQ